MKALPLQLLVDAGNSRLKWCLLRGARTGRVQVLAWGAGNAQRVAARAFAAARRSAGRAEVLRVLACSVAGTARERALRAAARRARLPAPLFIRSLRSAGGVRNGYDDPWRLGADRWVALVGARRRHPGRALCIVDAGTALTIDLLDAAGLHRGGLLVPGPALMVEALLRSTSGVRRRAGPAFRMARVGAAGRVFGRSTREGLASGALLASAALIDRAWREARGRLGGRPLLLVSGGAAPAILPLLRARAVPSGELVLAGLAAFAGAAPAAGESR